MKDYPEMQDEIEAAGGVSVLTKTLDIGSLTGIESVQILGFEWCRPSQQVIDDMMPHFRRFNGVAIETNVGPLVLTRVEKFSRGMFGGFRRVLVKAEELNNSDV